MSLKLGTRGSALAWAQSQLVAAAVTRITGEPVELVEIVTAGDLSVKPVQQLGVGVFVSALREALAAKEIDFAVHSYKDLPTAPADGLVIAAVPAREDPRDALVARDGLTLTELPAGATIGTGSLRRIAQLAALGLPVQTTAIRGNVDSRLRKVAEGELDAVVLARAGLLRLGRAAEVTEIIDPMLMLPAPAQGALAVECRGAEGGLADTLAALDDAATRAAVAAERALLGTLEAGCSAPVAALAEVTDDDEIYLRAAVISTDGRYALRLSRSGPLGAAPLERAAQIGRLLAADLLAEGAAHVLHSDMPGDADETNDEPNDSPGSAA